MNSADALKEKAMANSRFSRGMVRFTERKLAAAEGLAELQTVASVRAAALNLSCARAWTDWCGADLSDGLVCLGMCLVS